MSLKRITAPSALPVALTDARLALRSDELSLQPLILAWIGGVTDHAEHYMGRSILTQTWQLTLDSFPDEITLRMPPVVSISSIKYLDTSGNEQTLSPSLYVLDNVTEPCRVTPSHGASWPDTYNQMNAVTVDYITGYGATDASTPNAIKLYILAKLVEQFDPTANPNTDTVQSTYIDRLLDRYRILEFG